MKKNIVTVPEKIIPEQTFDDCTCCDNCVEHPYTEYEGSYYTCKILKRIVGYEGFMGQKGYGGFEPDIPNDCPLLEMN